MKKYFQLCLTFIKIGLFSFGGGYAMIPLIEKEIVEKNNWIKRDDLLDMIAISESTPGPIAVNLATFIGFQCGGLPGGILATLSVALPSFIIILVLSSILRTSESLKTVQYAFIGIRAGILALILKALISMYQSCPKTTFSYFVIAAAFFAKIIFPALSAIYIIISCGLAGTIHTLLLRNKCIKGGTGQ
ncbi:chromate transporter [Anaeromicropila populeti]|uniref:Chromate transporter n=1 Tax=Anaeromicropila populeti TaxID=37658 RepID=A0A1I6LNQ6_9FIRM|nr:chromate transporter [Anaeromicropila populeti]SFS05157.1 chromate transporter [Anaeromicropila populeti]